LETHGRGEIVLGDGCSIGKNAHITASNKITLGKNVLTGKNIIITDNGHGTTDVTGLNILPSQRHLHSKGAVKIGENVVILPDVVIGDAAIIGATAVITKDVPLHCVAVENPARIINFK
jgi:acetyltransferase-like isoleucine patch superfamily enzyme